MIPDGLVTKAIAITACVATICYGIRCMQCSKKLVINDLFFFAMTCCAVVSALGMATEGLVSSFGENPPKTAVFMIIFGLAVAFVSGQKAYKIFSAINRKTRKPN